MILPDDKARLQVLIKRTQHLWKFLECDDKKLKLRIGGAMSSPAFWDDQENAEKLVRKTIGLNRLLLRSRIFL